MKTFPKEEVEKWKLTFYSLPQDLDLKNIDPLIRPVVEKINESGWVWTAESCQGHPDAATYMDTAWGFNTDPYLRLIVSRENVGKMLELLVRSMKLPDDEYGMGHTCNLQLFSAFDDFMGPWCQVMLYIKAFNVLGRNQGLQALMQFAEKVNA